MLKLIKWNGINFIKKYNAYYMVFVLTLLVAQIFPTQSSYSDAAAAICSIIGTLLMVMSILLLIEITFSWLNGRTAILENSIPIDSSKILLSKIIFLIFIQLINCVLIMLLSLALTRFATENVRYLYMTFNNPIEATISYLFLINLVVLSDFIARRVEKKYHTFFAIMIFIALGIVLLYTFAFFLKITGSADVVFNGLSFSVQYENNLLVRYIFYVLFTIVFFTINCSLLKNKIDV